ncbi:MAG: CarD family transcriptional regulator [Candidatus Andersenbacteria bacterium]
MPVRGFVERLPAVERFKAMTVRLSVGDTASQSKVLHDLEEIGYEPADVATTVGTFARRGELLEVYSPHETHPVRITFAGSTVESIVHFDIETKKPLAETSQAASGSTTGVQQMRAVPLKLLMSQGRLIKYLGDPSKWSVVIDDPDDLKASIDPLGLKNEQEWRGLTKELATAGMITFHAFLEEKTADTHLFNFTVPPLFRGHLPSLREEIKEFHRKKYAIRVLTGDAAKIRASLDSSVNYVDVEMVSGSLRENLAGFRDGTGKLLVLTDREIYGPESVQPAKMRKAKRFDQAFIGELEPGHYVVHVDHGIGRFLGMVHNLLSGIEKEYFVLQYAEGDRLYVPVEAAEKLSRYIGAANPVIHRLSETSWMQIRAQLKESTEKLAKELLQLYAERQVRGGMQFKPEQAMEREFAKTFPYEETPDQLRAWHEIQLDMQRPRPMDRLLVG